MHDNTKELSVFFADYYSTIRPKAKFFASISLGILNYFKLVWAIFVKECSRNTHQTIVVRRDCVRIGNII